MLLPKQDTIRKGQVNKLLALNLEQKLDIKDDKEYEVKAILGSEAYVREDVSLLL